MLLLKWIPSQVFLIEVWNIFKSTILESLRVINIKRARTFPVDKFQFLLIFYKSGHQKKPCFWKRRVWAFHFLTCCFHRKVKLKQELNPSQSIEYLNFGILESFVMFLVILIYTELEWFSCIIFFSFYEFKALKRKFPSTHKF